ncbi:chromosome partitioning protein ParA [Vibrio metschnikovii]|uniref:chromosome partitioning protein ParA n=1 Tax=Vibrio metschnikovii TaxID=28172 RepID=UPI0016458EF7|nr:chromosome partitioning protein ParA [Vibrio metschnikovii]MBC3616582.1 chromosome partitioning protein ParA [Vibrio metschnikovii]MBC5812377.1 chromosome partitioning protein ParA [Vibrio metschnikovii]
MNQKKADEHQDVVVIEQRDKRSYLYIGLAAALGLALGGLVGSSVTETKWQTAYAGLQVNVQALQENAKALNEQTAQQTERQEQEWQVKLQQHLEQQKKQNQEQLDQLEQQIAELEKVNLSLDQQLAKQNNALQSADEKNARLHRQADMQSILFERSRELFQKELKIKQEVEQLQKEQKQLNDALPILKKECDVYLKGQSWDAKSDACDKQDAASSRLSQVEQMLRVHQLDLQEIKSLSAEIGL